MKIRNAKEEDIAKINDMLFQVGNIHASIHHDIFKENKKNTQTVNYLK